MFICFKISLGSIFKKSLLSYVSRVTDTSTLVLNNLTSEAHLLSLTHTDPTGA